MREILFRGKWTDNGEWVYGDLVTQNYPVFSKLAIPLILDMDGVWEVIPETVGQFTGLTDKNGRQIFEGDIVKEHRSCDALNKYTVYAVSYKRYMFIAETDNCSISLCSITVDSELEVIGNIHDTPELLEDKP